MSVESMAQALKMQGLKPIDKLLLIGIANHDGDGGAWPTLATLSTYLGKCERTTQYVLTRLVRLGLVTVERNAGGNNRTPGNRRPNLYHLHLSPGVQQVATPNGSGVQELAPQGCNEVAPKPSLNHPLLSSPSDLRAEPVDVQQVAERELREIMEHVATLLTSKANPTNRIAYRNTILRNRRDHFAALLDIAIEQPLASSVEIACLYVGGEQRPPRLAWTAEPSCTNCGGDGWEHDEAQNALVPCGCRQVPT